MVLVRYGLFLEKLNSRLVKIINQSLKTFPGKKLILNLANSRIGILLIITYQRLL